MGVESNEPERSKTMETEGGEEEKPEEALGEEEAKPEDAQPGGEQKPEEAEVPGPIEPPPPPLRELPPDGPEFDALKKRLHDFDVDWTISSTTIASGTGLQPLEVGVDIDKSEDMYKFIVTQIERMIL